MRFYINTLSITFLISFTFTANAQDDFPEAELPPLQRVVFYNSGVAHMQHRGEITDKARLTIRFSGHDVDDVLKSLVFEDTGGGHVRAVEYQPAPNPEDVAANNFGPMTLAQLLQKFRGESVSLTAKKKTNRGELKLEGQVFGVENRTDENSTNELLVLMDADGAMRSVWLNEIQNLRFSSEEVQKEMALAMTGVAKSRKSNQRKLDLLFDGEGKRDVGFGYVIDAPIWRMSYRLEVEPEQVQLQGWTYINNVTGVDWKAVEVELRSGQPQAFHAELFAPVLAERESVGLNPFGLPKELTLVRQWYGFEPAARFANDRTDYGGGKYSDMGGGLGGGMMGGMFGGGGGGGASSEKRRGAATRRGIDASSAFQKIASLDRTGTTVRFQLDKPVNLPSGKSAALPVFTQKLPSRILSVVKHQDEANNLTAVKAIELTNATKYSLVAGPITVSREGDFVGDAQIDRVAVGAKTLLPYSVDRAIEVTRKASLPRSVSERIRLSGRRDIAATLEKEMEVRFTINNEDKDPRLMYLEYVVPKSLFKTEQLGDDPFASDPTAPKEDTGVAINPQPEKTEGDVLIYEVPTAALAKTNFSITVKWTEKKIEPMRDVAAAKADRWLADVKDIDDTTKDKLQELVSTYKAIAENRGLIARLNQERSNYVTEQSRARTNLSPFDVNSDDAKPFVERMLTMEESIRKVATEIAAAKEKSIELERRKNSL